MASTWHVIMLGRPFFRIVCFSLHISVLAHFFMCIRDCVYRLEQNSSSSVACQGKNPRSRPHEYQFVAFCNALIQTSDLFSFAIVALQDVQTELKKLKFYYSSFYFQ